MPPAVTRLSASIEAALRPIPSQNGAEGRSKERFRRAGLTAGAAAVAKVATFAASAITVPLAIHALGTERFGLWLALQALVNTFVFADLGVGSALKNAVASANASGDPGRLRAVMGSGYLVVGALAIFCGAVILLVAFLTDTDVASVLGLPPALHGEAGVAAAILFALFCLSLPLNLTAQIQAGLQSGYVTQLWQSVAALCTPVVVAMVMWRSPHVPALALAVAGTPMVFMALNTYTYFTRGGRDTRLLPFRFERPCARGLLHNGLLFLTLSLAGAAAFTSDNIVLSRMFGPGAVAPYAVTYQMCAVIGLLPGIAFGGLWPAYADAVARGDLAWIHSTLRRVVKLTLLVTVPAAVVLVMWGPSVARWWTAGRVEPTRLLLIGMVIWIVLMSVGGVVATFLNGAGVVRFQVLQAGAFGIAALLLKILAAARFGPDAVAFANAIAYAAFVIVPFWIFVPRLLKRMAAGSTHGP